MEIKRYNGRTPNQRAEHSSEESWIKSANEEVQRHLDTLEKLKQPLILAKQGIKTEIMWTELFLQTEDFKDKEKILKLRIKLKELKDLIK